MKDFLQSILKTTEERLKNPFVGAFTTSWILFNWKPILFVIFSSKNIEEKIKFIDENFAEINHLLWFPSATAVFYVLILPYVGLFFDILLKYSLLKRNEIVVSKQKQNIENQKQLAIEEIKLEEAKTEYREREKHNELVESLQKQLIEKDNQITEEIKKNESLLVDARKQIQRTNKQIEELSQSTTSQIQSYAKETELLKQDIIQKERHLDDLQREHSLREIEMDNHFSNLQQENYHLSTELNELKRQLAQSYNEMQNIENSINNNRLRDINDYDGKR